jgi:signal transduction histidine kinase
MPNHLHWLIPENNNLDLEQQFRVRIFIYLCFYFPFILVVTLVCRSWQLALTPGQWAVGLLDALGCLICLALVARLRLFRLGLFLFWLLSAVLVIGAALLNGGVLAPAVAFVGFMPFLATALGGKSAGRWGLLATVAILFSIYLMDSWGWCQPYQLLNRDHQVKVTLVVDLGLMAFSFLFATAYENSRRFSEQKLLEMARLKDISILAAGIAHEVNNPMTGILANTDLLAMIARARPPPPNQLHRAVDQIRQCVRRVVIVTDALSKYADAGGTTDEHYSEVSLVGVIEQASLLCAQRFDAKGIRLDFPGSTDDVRVLGNQAQILQVLMTLLGNSYDAVVASDVDEKWVSVRIRKTAGVVEIGVEDSGLIAADVQKNIFSPFFTTKGPRHADKLPLPLSEKFINQHGGRLYLDTSALHTKFVIQLPV